MKKKIDFACDSCGFASDIRCKNTDSRRYEVTFCPCCGYESVESEEDIDYEEDEIEELGGDF